MNGIKLHPLFFLLLLIVLPLCAESETEELRHEKIRKTLETLPSSYQKELPKQRRPRQEVRQREPKKRKERKPRREPKQRDFSFNAPLGGGVILKVCMYIVLFVVVLLFIIWLINHLRNRDSDGSDEDLLKVKRVDGDDEEPSYDISDADKLAGKGELTEAIHLLYLEVILWLQKRGSLKIKKSLTNREILRASSLSFEKTRTLGAFIAMVEELYFGDVPATMTHYEQSKEYAESIMRGNNG